MIGQNMAAVVNIVSRHGLSVGACHRNQPNKSKVALYKHRYTNYVHGIGNGNSRMDIPCPVVVGSYLLTINAVLLISTLSF